MATTARDETETDETPHDDRPTDRDPVPLAPRHGPRPSRL
jgi:hypothetical protein